MKKVIAIPLDQETYVWESRKYFEEKYILPITNEYKANREVRIPNFEACAINNKGEIVGLLVGQEMKRV